MSVDNVDIVTVSKDDLEAYKEVVGILIDALRHYASPEFYHAIAIIPDRPAGGFADDFSSDHGDPDYKRPMPGSFARDTIKEIMERFPNLQYLDFE